MKRDFCYLIYESNTGLALSAWETFDLANKALRIYKKRFKHRQFFITSLEIQKKVG